VNHSSRRKSGSPVARWLTAFAVLASIIAPLEAQAQFSGKAAVTGQFESNSNVFNLDTGIAPPTGAASRRGDSFFAYGARFDLDYLLGRQEFFASAGTTELDYQRYTQLDHDDYRLDAGLNYKIASLLTGKVDITRTRTMVPFYDLTGTTNVIATTTLSLQTTQREEVEADYAVTPEWRIEGDGYTSKIDEPLPQSPELSLTETSGKITLRYLGLTRLTGGGFAGYDSGTYDGSDASTNPDYHQDTAGITATYRSPRATFDGTVGYSRRTSATGTDDTSGVTGDLKLREQLTYKTSVSFEFGRAIQSYLFNAGSEIDTTLGVSAAWQATYKLGVTLGYKYIYRDYPGQGNDPVGSERVDIQSAVTLNIDYRPREWLSIRPYANLQWRISNFIGGEYQANVFGLYVSVMTFGK
jgi:hypothetical protein